MNKWKILFLIGVSILLCEGREPYKPRHGVLPFIVYFPSRYRGLCVGSLISRTAVLTAAICVTSPDARFKDQRSINVVVGTTYRHPRRGIRVQVTKLLIPNYAKLSVPQIGYMMARSPAVMILKRRVPDILTEVPLRPIDVHYSGEESLPLQEECLMAGWHFFYQGDKIYPVNKFLLQRNVRAQPLNVVKKNIWCEALSLKFHKALNNLGFTAHVSREKESTCVRDPDRIAQPCHGMYGAPLICRGKIFGLMLAPDAQWTNCTGFSNLIHRLDHMTIRGFMTCISSLFETDVKLDWAKMRQKEGEDSEENGNDYDSDIYNRLMSSSSEEIQNPMSMSNN